MNPLIHKALLQLRTHSGYWNGDGKAERVLTELLEDVLRPIKAGLSFDPAEDRDLETCARRIYHERSSALIAQRNASDALVRSEQQRDALERINKGLEEENTNLRLEVEPFIQRCKRAEQNREGAQSG